MLFVALVAEIQQDWRWRSDRQLKILHEDAVQHFDKFEALGLSILRRGDDLFTSRDGKDLRMLGAVYSGHQCLSCQCGERGDLLGALSYTLQPDAF